MGVKRRYGMRYVGKLYENEGKRELLMMDQYEKGPLAEADGRKKRRMTGGEYDLGNQRVW